MFRGVVEDIGNQHEGVEFGFRIKEELLLEDEEKKAEKDVRDLKAR